MGSSCSCFACFHVIWPPHVSAVMVKCGPVALVIFGASVLTLLFGLYSLWAGHSTYMGNAKNPARRLKKYNCRDAAETDCDEFKPAWGASKEFTVDPHQFDSESIATLDGGNLFIKKDSGKDCSAVFDGIKVQSCPEAGDCIPIATTKLCGQAFFDDFTEVASFIDFPFEGHVWKVTSTVEGVYFFDDDRYVATKALAGIVAWLAAAVVAAIPLSIASCCCCCAVVACLVTPSEGTAAREPMQMQLA